MTELNERQKKFIGAVLSRKSEENRPVLEAVLKAYAINEGLVDKFKTIAGKARATAGKAIDKAKRATSHDMAKIQEPPKKPTFDYATVRKAMIFEPDCWDRDLNRFYQNCELVQYYLSNYGIKDFNEIVGSEQFKKAIELGKVLDKMRVNPLARDDARRRNMHECLQKFFSGDNRVLVEGIMTDFDESETVTVELPPIFEAREDNLGAFREAGVAHQLLVEELERAPERLGCKAGLFLVLYLLGDGESFGEVRTELYLGRIQANYVGLEQDALGNHVELGEVHRLNLELPGTEELEVRVLGFRLDFGHFLLGVFLRHELGIGGGWFLALLLGLGAGVGVLLVLGDNLLQFLHAATVGILQAVRENGTDFDIEGKVANLELALLGDKVPVEHRHSLDVVGTLDWMDCLDFLDMC